MRLAEALVAWPRVMTVGMRRGGWSAEVGRGAQRVAVLRWQRGEVRGCASSGW